MAESNHDVCTGWLGQMHSCLHVHIHHAHIENQSSTIDTFPKLH